MTGQFEAAAQRRDERIGHNNPPSLIENAEDTRIELSVFMKELPVIQSHADAKAAGAWVERSRIALAELETERTTKVGPLNAQLAKINSAYRMVREPLEKVLRELKRRITDYAAAEEAKRIAEANRLRQEAEERERIARQAEANEADAKAAVDVGELGVDVGAAITEADARFADFERANRQAATAEKNVPVKITSALGGKALSMRTKRVLVVADAAKAINAIGMTDDIRTAILRAAKHFEEAHGELPAGITETFERSL